MSDELGADLRPANSSAEIPDARRDRPLPLRQMGIGELLDAAFRLYRLEWRTLIGIVALVMIPVTFVQVWVTQLWISSLTAFPRASDVGTQAVILGVTMTAIQFLLVQPFLTAAITKAAADVYLGERIGIGRTFRYALSRLGPILWITIIATVATLAGFLLLIIPGIIVLVRLAFTAPVLVAEDRRGAAAVRRSWRLSAGHFWRIFAAVIAAGLIVGVVSFILSLPAEFIVQSVGPDAWPISALATAVVAILTTPFSTLVLVLLYFDLRIRKEGFDIEVMAREIAAAP
jgi:hypothetical protein